MSVHTMIVMPCLLRKFSPLTVDSCVCALARSCVFALLGDLKIDSEVHFEKFIGCNLIKISHCIHRAVFIIKLCYIKLNLSWSYLF